MKILCIGDSLTSCWNIDKRTTILAEKIGAQVKVDAGGGRMTWRSLRGILEKGL